MKLKKIAALALAGVMAVSMLAGCGTDKKPGTGEGEGEGTVTTTGYSASVEKAMDLDKDTYDYITFKDNADDQAALQKAVNSLSAATLEDIAEYYLQVHEMSKINAADGKTMLKDLASDLKIYTGWGLDMGSVGLDNLASNYDANTNGVRGGVVFAVNGGVDSEYALEAVAAAVKDEIKGLVEDHTTASQVVCTYDYVVSVSAVTRTQQDNYTAANNATTFILVTTTRNVTM